jgi:hypothetical protein
MSFSAPRALRLLTPLLLPLVLGACGTLIGSQKPVARRAHAYTVRDLAAEPGGDWRKLPSARSEEDLEVSDVSYQSRSMAGIISLNSVCRARNADPALDLRGITGQLFLGLEEAGPRTERPRRIDGIDALETTLEGRMSAGGKREPVKLRAVVLRRDACVFDLMYVARPERFDSKLGDFERFVDSLRLESPRLP